MPEINFLKFYKDEELREEISPDALISFGRVKAGETKVVTLYIKNDSKAYIEEILIKTYPVEKVGNKMVEVTNGEMISIEKAPEILDPYEIDQLVLSWTATIDFEQALLVQLDIAVKAVLKPGI
jgi:hypothetical protein